MLDPVVLSQEQLGLLTPLVRLLASTLILIVGILVARALSARFIRRHVASVELRRKWLVQTRNGLMLLFLLGLVIIWGDELRTLALSVVAIAVAFVVATKELILCITGSIIKTGASSFDIGDRIQIKDFRGDVIDHNLLATTLMEVGPGKLTHQRTGRITVIPNALFVSDAVINETHMRLYTLHVFTIPFKREDNWLAAQQAFLASARRHCEPYIEEARRYMTRHSDQRGLESLSIDPRVTVQVPAAGEVHLVVRLPVKATQRSVIEQSILVEVLSQDFSDKSSSSTP